MATPDPDAYVAAQNGAVRLAIRDLRAFWARLDHTDPLAVRVALESFWPVLLARYGEVTATLAADRFEEITGLDGVMVRPVDSERANARMRWAVDPLFGGEGEAAALALLGGLVDELVKQPGRSTLIRSAEKHRLRFARVPTGADTCKFCLMLASRGFAYSTRKSAGDSPDMRSKFHGGKPGRKGGTCDCRIVMEGEDAPGYNPEALYDRYDLARQKAGSGDPKAILAAWREIEGGS